MEQEQNKLTDYFGVNLAQLLAGKISATVKDFPTENVLKLKEISRIKKN